MSGRNTQFRQFTGMKPHLLLLNKVDLCDANYNKRIEAILAKQGIGKVLYSNCLQEKPTILRDMVLFYLRFATLSK